MHKLLLATLLSSLLATPAFAQGFISPVSSISPKQPSYAILSDGTKIEGTIPAALFMNGGLKSFTLVDSDGTKHKLKAADVKELANKPGALAKMSALSNQIDSKFDMITADWGEVIDRKWVYYRQATMPNGKSTSLLQQVNPGFDGRMKVFNIDPEEPEEYMVTKDGGAGMKIHKGNYKKEFEALFGDCKAVMGSETAKKPKIKYFATHAFVFDKECGKK
jgi:hypothetical protein